jgi:heme-degrading monooxygenase HmoA
MHVVVFEVSMKEGRTDQYFDLAASLRPELETVDGFISVERFESVATPGKFVSISFWRDADAVRAWRENAGHAIAQDKGKTEVFADFRISVAEVERQYTMAERVAGD